MSGAPSWLPDWRKQELYARYEDLTLHLSDLAWQFLRRNPDYQQDWEEHMAPFYNPATKGFDVDAARNYSWDKLCPWPFQQDCPPLEYMQAQYGIRCLFAAPDRVDGSSFKFTPNYLQFFKPPPQYSQDQTYKLPIEIKPTQVLMMFNLDIPLNGQIKRVKEELYAMAKHHKEIQETPSRKLWRMYPIYLRVLDGVAAGASLEEIAKEIYPRLDCTYPDGAGFTRIRDSKTKALQLVKRGYLGLINE